MRNDLCRKMKVEDTASIIVHKRLSHCFLDRTGLVRVSERGFLVRVAVTHMIFQLLLAGTGHRLSDMVFHPTFR
jgi:hypothetical protein